MGSVISATDFEWGTPNREAVASAYMSSWKAQSLASLVSAILALLVSLPIKNIRLGEENEDGMEEDQTKGKVEELEAPGKKEGDVVAA